MYNKNIKEAFSELNSSEKGLSKEEVDNRLKEYGRNELKEKKIHSFTIFLNQFKNFMIYILIFAAIISAVIGVYDSNGKLELKDFTDTIVIVVILLLNAILGFVQEYKAEKSIEALKKLASLKARVLRNNEIVEIEARDLVPGDVIMLEEGDKIPADARLIKAINLELQEAILTGESTSVEKSIEKLKDNLQVADQKNMVFSGTIITKGRGMAIVSSTGMKTEIGKIAEMIQGIDDETPLQIKFKRLSKTLTFGVIGLCFIILLIGLILQKDSFLNLFMASVSLAVAAIPESLPAVVTISLALGVRKMLKKNALIRRLPSVETLGSTSIICVDKTGTLTKNEMTVKKIFVNNKIINVSGEGYDFNGKFDDTKNIELLLKIGSLCNNSSIKEKPIGDPTEIALLVSARKMGIKKDNLEFKYPRIDEIPFSSERKMMSTLHDVDGKKIYYTKGASEILLKKCDKIWIDGRVKNLMPRDRKQILKVSEEFSKNALRVLAFAYGKDEKNMVFVGLQAMIDPPRLDAIESIKKCESAGIRVIMITGDHKLTAEAIGKEMGIKGKVITGEELDKIKDLSKIVNEIGIYARVNPKDKLRIIEALRKNNHIVAMTGDGVNDAPALKEADIGIAVGSGTDVAKEASDMILVDDNFTSIVNAIEEGRGIWDNIKKDVFYLLSSNISELLIILIGIFLGLPLPLLALQILWINLVTDGLPALALGVNPIEKGIMKRKPRNSKEEIISKNMLLILGLIGIIITIGSLGLFIYYKNDLNLARTMAFSSLIVFEIFNSLNLASNKHLNFFYNKWLVLAGIVSIGLTLLIMYSGLNSIFSIVPLSIIQWGWIILVASSITVVYEIRKSL